MEEVWKNIESVDSLYEISDSGSVRNKQSGKFIHIGTNDKGYPRVYLKKNGKLQSFYLHRLLLLSFVGQPGKGEKARHLDGNPQNYSLSNLKWGTKSENEKDKTRHGTRFYPDNRGSRSCKSKLSDAQVLEIDSLILRGLILKRIANKFGVSVRTIWSIKKRETYTYLWINPQLLNQTSKQTIRIVL